MKVSVNSIRELNQRYNCADNIAPNGVDVLAEKIGAQLGAVEEIIDFGSKYAQVLVAKVISCEDHPDADRLHICKIDDGRKAEQVERDEDGYVTVVCGAPNVRQGLTVAWLPPGSTVPNTVDKDPFVLEARPLRGVISNGMLASPRELAIGDSHDGIIELDTDAAPGTPFAEAYNLKDDRIIDIENKMFTHRPDCFGLLGVARELAGIQHMPFKSPDWYRADATISDVETEELALDVRNELPELVPRFMAITMRNVDVGPSPIWCQIELVKAGIRPINNIVDYTNYFMLQTGQPLHAYDYDKVVTQDEGADRATITIRRPRQGEKIALLNGKEIEPRPEAIMIATRDKLIGVGGVMGGADTEVDERTKNIILECGNFDMYSVRRTSMAHGLFTDAVTRFNKGQSPLQNQAVLAKIVDDIRLLAGGKVAGPLIDDNHVPEDARERNSMHAPVVISRDFINARLGLTLSDEEITTLLTNVEFDVQAASEEKLTVKAPFWRTDIEIPEDIVEEVGRLYGFDQLPLELPRRSIMPAPEDELMALKTRIRNVLSAAGANEILTYSFVHGNLLDKAGQDREQAFRLSNALSPDLQYYRTSVTPSLLEKIHPNIKAGHNEFALFELAKTHAIGHDIGGLPDEPNRLALVLTKADKKTDDQEGAAFYSAKLYAVHLLRALGIRSYRFIPYPHSAKQGIPSLDAWIAPFDIARTAYIAADVQGHKDTLIGFVGEYKQSVSKALKLPTRTAGFELDVTLLHILSETEVSTYTPASRFPRLEQDLCLKVPISISYQQVYELAVATLDEARSEDTRVTITPVDIYQREDDVTNKQITLRFGLVNYERTLTDDEVSKMLGQVAERARHEIDAEQM